jgi:hypothetical protein
VYNDAQLEVEKFENSVAMEKLELVDLLQEHSAISEQLHETKKGGGMSFWPKCFVLHLNRLPSDSPNMNIMKACGLCAQWYHGGDIAITSCLYTYHLTCLGQHLKTHKRCKMCNQRMHLDWWSSWGFKNMDQELTFAKMEMGIEEE